MRRLLFVALLLGTAACSGAEGTPYQRGLAAFNKGDIGTARVETLNALQADPNDRSARILQARVQLVLGDGIAAESELARAARTGVPATEINHLLAHARLLQGDPAGALRQAAGAGSAHRAYAARISGRAHMLAGDGDSALLAFNEALALKPNDADLWTDIGRFRRGNGDVARALEAIDRALASNPRHVEALVQRGELTRSQYGLAASLPWFDRALEVDANNVTALLERAITYGDMGRMRDMLADARLVLVHKSDHPTAHYLLAVLAARGGDFELARLLYNRTRGAFDSSPAGILLSGAIDYGTGNAEQAVRRLSDLVASQPGNRKARRLLAASYWRAGDARGTIATLEPIVERPDSDSYSHALMGQALRRLGDRNGAAYHLALAARPSPPARSTVDPLSDREFDRLRQAAAAQPGDGPLQVRLVSALLARGFTGEAIERSRRLQREHGGVPEVHLLVGDALGLTGDFAGAAEQYRRAANLAFTEPTALRLIEALQRSGQVDSADGVLRLFLQQNPGNIPAQFLLAGRSMQAGDFDIAIAFYERLRRRLGDNDSTILNNLAWAYAQIGDYDSAVPLARRAWALNRNNPVTADTLGWILFRSGNRAEGLVLLQQASRGPPGEATIRARLDAAAPAALSEAPGGPGSALPAG